MRPNEDASEVVAPGHAPVPATAGACGCDPEKLRVLHCYLEEQFRGYVLRDFHAPVRLMQAGLPSPHGEHHVISIERHDVLPYYAVLLNDFLVRPAEEITDALWQWDVADALRADRIVVASARGSSSL